MWLKTQKKVNSARCRGFNRYIFFYCIIMIRGITGIQKLNFMVYENRRIMNKFFYMTIKSFIYGIYQRGTEFRLMDDRQLITFFTKTLSMLMILWTLFYKYFKIFYIREIYENNQRNF